MATQREAVESLTVCVFGGQYRVTKTMRLSVTVCPVAGGEAHTISLCEFLLLEELRPLVQAAEQQLEGASATEGSEADASDSCQRGWAPPEDRAPEVMPAAAEEGAPEVMPAAAEEGAPEVMPAAAEEGAPEVMPAVAEGSPEVAPAAAEEGAPEVAPEAAAEGAPEIAPAAAEIAYTAKVTYILPGAAPANPGLAQIRGIVEQGLKANAQSTVPLVPLKLVRANLNGRLEVDAESGRPTSKTQFYEMPSGSLARARELQVAPQERAGTSENPPPGLPQSSFVPIVVPGRTTTSNEMVMAAQEMVPPESRALRVPISPASPVQESLVDRPERSTELRPPNLSDAGDSGARDGSHEAALHTLSGPPSVIDAPEQPASAAVPAASNALYDILASAEQEGSTHANGAEAVTAAQSNGEPRLQPTCQATPERVFSSKAVHATTMDTAVQTACRSQSAARAPEVEPDCPGSTNENARRVSPPEKRPRAAQDVVARAGSKPVNGDAIDDEVGSDAGPVGFENEGSDAGAPTRVSSTHVLSQQVPTWSQRDVLRRNEQVMAYAEVQDYETARNAAQRGTSDLKEAKTRLMLLRAGLYTLRDRLDHSALTEACAAYQDLKEEEQALARAVEQLPVVFEQYAEAQSDHDYEKQLSMLGNLLRSAADGCYHVLLDETVLRDAFAHRHMLDGHLVPALSSLGKPRLQELYPELFTTFHDVMPRYLGSAPDDATMRLLLPGRHIERHYEVMGALHNGPFKGVRIHQSPVPSRTSTVQNAVQF